MITRWRMIHRPDGEHDPPHPEVREAFGSWVLGTLWTLGVLGLALRSERALVTLALGAGLFAMWAWRRDGWVAALPGAALLALAADLLTPGRPGTIGYLELLVAGVALVAIARFVAVRGLGTSPAPRAAMPGVLPLPVAVAALIAVSLTAGAPASWLRPCLVAAALYFAARAATPRLGRWAWGVLGLATAWVVLATAAAAAPAVAASFGMNGAMWSGEPAGAIAAPLLALIGGLARHLLWPKRGGETS